MWDNRLDKKNPKAPDWKCKDIKCKWEKDPDTKEWVRSKFQTAVWEKKDDFTKKAEGELDELKEEEKWQKLREEKNQNITWLNAKNNAVEIVTSKGIMETESIRDEIVYWANWIYKLKPTNGAE